MLHFRVPFVRNQVRRRKYTDAGVLTYQSQTLTIANLLMLEFSA